MASSLAVRLIPSAKRTNLFAFVDVRNATSLYLHHLIVFALLLYELKYFT